MANYELFITIPIFIRSCNRILQQLFVECVSVLWCIESGLTSLKIINDLHDIKMFAVISNMFSIYLKIFDRTKESPPEVVYTPFPYYSAISVY